MHSEGYTLARMCRLFGKSRQGMHQRRQRQELRSRELAVVIPLVEQVRRSMPRIGGRKLYHLLKPEFECLGLKLGRDGFFSYLREYKLLVVPKKTYTKTTDGKHWMRKYPNLLLTHRATEPEQVFVSDITYVKSREGTHYLSLVTDAYSRKIMGYHLSEDMSSEEVSKALHMAIAERRAAHRLIHHSDRGLQYCSGLYQQVLRIHQITPSMTEGYDCYQNALAERVNGILKQEFLIYPCNTKKELEKMVSESVNTYNTRRPHWSLNFQTPEQVHTKMAELTLSHASYS